MKGKQRDVMSSHPGVDNSMSLHIHLPITTLPKFQSIYVKSMKTDFALFDIVTLGLMSHFTLSDRQ